MMIDTAALTHTLTSGDTKGMEDCSRGTKESDGVQAVFTPALLHSAAVILGSGRVCESALSTLDGCEPGSRSSSSSSRKTAAYHLTRVSTDWRPICLKGKMLTSANCWPAIIKLNSADKQQLEALEYLRRPRRPHSQHRAGKLANHMQLLRTL